MENKTKRRSRLTSVGIGTLLLLSIVLSLFYIFGNPSSILDRTHRIDKKVTNNSITWTGMYVQQSNAAAEHDEGRYYELWREEERSGSVLLVENFPINFFSSVSWEINKQNGINTRFYTGGPEVGLVTEVVYNDQGAEQIRVERTAPNNGYFTFRQKDKALYQASAFFREGCYKDDGKPIPNLAYLKDEIIPEVTLKGILIDVPYAKGRFKKEFVLAKPEKLKCEIYDGSFIEPRIEMLKFDDKSIEFVLPNNQKGTIKLLGSEFPEVKFK